MPLYILVPMVVFGVSGMVLLIWLLRPTNAFQMSGPEQAIEVWNHFNYENQASEARLNDDGSFALVTTGKGTGLVWSFGTDPLTRTFRKKAEIVADASGLHINTSDFTAPILHIPLSAANERAEWVDKIKGKAKGKK